jgi:peptide deformylase
MSLMKSVEHYGGLGLAANQCGFPVHMLVINHIEDDKIYCLINANIVEMSPETSDHMEGCLSYPGLFLKIGRPEWVLIEFQALNGEVVRKKFEGIYATCVMHEIDHLRGIFFTDLVSPITLDIAKRKVKTNLKKIKRATTEGIEVSAAPPETPAPPSKTKMARSKKKAT